MKLLDLVFTVTLCFYDEELLACKLAFPANKIHIQIRNNIHPESFQHLSAGQHLAMKTNLHSSRHVRLHFKYVLVIFNPGG